MQFFCFYMACFLLSQADVVNVSPGTQYTVTVAAASASSSNIGPGVSRMINTNESGEIHTHRERESTQTCYVIYFNYLVLEILKSSAFPLPFAD